MTITMKKRVISLLLIVGLALLAFAGCGRVEEITIKGKTYSTKLTKLALLGQELTDADIEPLKYMTNLTVLDLNYNEISDISALRRLSNLTVLNLSNTQISDISALSGFNNLTELHLSNLQISDISALSGLNNLTKLYLNYNEISDISVLNGLSNLTELYLDYNEISDISVLSGLSNLTVLHLACNKISDVSALSGLNNLTELYLHYYLRNQWWGLRNLSGYIYHPENAYPRQNQISEEQIKELSAALPNCSITY
jgi:Leucine-rich repeat (LRR) protein